MPASLRRTRGPHVHLVAHARKSFGNLTRVVADTANVRNYSLVMMCQVSHGNASAIAEETIGLVPRVGIKNANQEPGNEGRPARVTQARRQGPRVS